MQLVFVYRKSLMASQRSSSQKTFPKVGLLFCKLLVLYFKLIYAPIGAVGALKLLAAME